MEILSLRTPRLQSARLYSCARPRTPAIDGIAGILGEIVEGIQDSRFGCPGLHSAVVARSDVLENAPRCAAREGRTSARPFARAAGASRALMASLSSISAPGRAPPGLVPLPAEGGQTETSWGY